MRCVSTTIRWALQFLVVVSLLAAKAVAQEMALNERGPRFLWASSSGAPVEVAASSSAALRQVVSLNIERATVGSLLASVERQAGLNFIFSRAILPVDRPVALRADSITVGAALMVILMDAGVDVLLSSGKQVALVQRATRGVVPAGAVSGRVTDAKTGSALVQAEVWLEGTRRRAVTDGGGAYRLVDVEAGSYTLNVRRVGYRKQTQAVTVVAAQEVTADVALEPVATQLDEVVTTATGEQRLLELGHVVGRINADSLMKAAPISSVTELLTARVPGLVVQQASGIVGGEVSLRIRSPTSDMLNSEPIIIVDGVRYQSNPFVGPGSDYSHYTLGPFGGNEGTSRLNDLNPNDIDNVEVVKGPSAATLYGTDAATGVVVITSKRGRAGPARWNTYGRATTTSVPQYRYPGIYWGWSSAFGKSYPCALRDVAAGACVQDSVTVLPNPLNDASQTIFAAKPQWEYGLNVGGGHPDLRYYLSGDVNQQTGPIQLSSALVQAVKQQRGISQLPDELRKPNKSGKLSFRGSVTAAAGSRADLRLNVGYTQNTTRTLAFSNPFSGALFRSPDSAYRSSPIDIFSQNSIERVSRFTSSLGAELRPASWLRMTANIGLDHANSLRESLARVGEAPDAEPGGVVGDTRTRYVTTTADLGTTATWRRRRFSSRTAVGAQYVRSLSDILSSTGRGLPVGSESLNDAASVYTGKNYYERVTLGSYVEQTFGLNERLYLNGALRFDGAAGFGQAYKVATYPKVGLSWLVSEEPFLPHLPGVDELRLRYAFGASGQQAWPNFSRRQYFTTRAWVDGTLGQVAGLAYIGNPDLRPERVREHELGLDARAWRGRLGMSFTWNWRRTIDAIETIDLPAGFGYQYVNLGLIGGHGFELELTGQLIRSRPLTVDVALHHSWQDGKLLDLGGAAESKSSGYAEGFPLRSMFVPQVESFADANGDGIIDAGEVKFSKDLVYVGRSSPPRTQTLSVAVGGLDQRIRVTALLERQSGFVVADLQRWGQCANLRCRDAIDPTTSLGAQAEVGYGYVTAGFVHPGDFTRLREVSMSFDVPDAVVRTLRLRSASVTVSGRNLALWTSHGSDPESRSSAGSIPQARSWVLRADLGF
jgi:TonB-linked SusC/RagA family outer membrane protein